MTTAGFDTAATELSEVEARLHQAEDELAAACAGLDGAVADAVLDGDSERLVTLRARIAFLRDEVSGLETRKAVLLHRMAA